MLMTVGCPLFRRNFPIAKALIFAANEGYVEKLIQHQESYTGKRWYVRLLVPGGLTHKDTLFLASPDANAEHSLMDAVQLKPSIYGVGVDLKAFWHKWRGKKA